MQNNANLRQISAKRAERTLPAACVLAAEAGTGQIQLEPRDLSTESGAERVEAACSLASAGTQLAC